MTRRQYFEFFTTMAVRFHYRSAYERMYLKRATRGCEESGGNTFSFSRYGPWKVGNHRVISTSQA